MDGRSLIYIRNRRGPRNVPCGTTEVTEEEEDVLPSSTTFWYLSARKLCIQANVLLRMP